MDTYDPSAPPHAQSRTAGKNHPRRDRDPATDGKPRPGGVIHDNARHTARFTVIGNHLAQHPDLSLLAIGLATHIQSLPTGAPADIKSLAARFPEGPDRIAAALRELEAHGYLRRTRERVPGGRIVTRTVSCNKPGHHDTTASDTPRRPGHRTAPEERPARRLLPAVPQPSSTSPTLLRTATDLLSGLRRHDPRLLLSETDAQHLAPGVAAWLERDLTPTAVRDALTSDLPAEPLHRPAALLAHRLTDRLPPPPPFHAPPSPPEVLYPVRNCRGCDRGYRGPDPLRCDACSADGRADPVTGPLPDITDSPEADPAR
ncbi:helix-turn-helix domain-containing protein [Streptomyces sp. VNUA24]|uniref:helix-turn-helix domain-containing protein n=1 Tax=Streptomyces sp. VNUA24 TaxID=3031131 RepID=UPI0023B811DB|nr:helix-turn-helix domain-containing protein [Streptomyces sp. VNUA24]WEH16659.1 helix-turn-helix domain-containing protein [Streptomyces sp. VNUA24]